MTLDPEDERRLGLNIADLRMAFEQRGLNQEDVENALVAAVKLRQETFDGRYDNPNAGFDARRGRFGGIRR
jgi:hypothetical protein